tara:strand:- start:6869 stop:7369 length:501 start_codon:yes stop_codon:yes gene_type:complete
MKSLDKLYSFMLGNMCIRYKQTVDDMEDIMDRIAFHESHGDPKCHQYGGGPGRGLFQFETGVKEGGETAMNRLLRWFAKNNIKAPKWTNIPLDGVDASVLEPKAQKMLFLGNVRYHPYASLKGLNDENLPEWWAKYHWAGPQSQKDERIASFNDSMDFYERGKKNA